MKNELAKDDTFPKYINDFIHLARPITKGDLFPADKEFLEILILNLKEKELKQSVQIIKLKDALVEVLEFIHAGANTFSNSKRIEIEDKIIKTLTDK